MTFFYPAIVYQVLTGTRGESDHAEETTKIRRINYDDDEKDREQMKQSSALMHQRLSRRATQEAVIAPLERSSLLCGLLAGVAQAGVFNPYDRALYLSVKEHRRFLSFQNWQSPYTGFFQSIGGRALSGGLYFPLEHFFLRCFADQAEENSIARYNFVAGTAAGAANACVLNPLSAIKYKTWGRDVSRGMLKEAGRMISKAGSARPLFNGLTPTLYRDVVFGGCYTWLRLQIQWWFELEPNQQFLGNFVAAGLATIVSGPFNYVRNIQYSTSSRVRADSTWRVLKALSEQVREQPNVADKLHLLQNRLRIGWGTARVAMGMSFAHGVYNWLLENLPPYY